jgi:hypothetical protein
VSPAIEAEPHPFLSAFLEPADIAPTPSEALYDDHFVDAIAPHWVWHDPYADCAYIVQEGLEIQAANGRDLWEVNHGAPRLLRSAHQATDSGTSVVSDLGLSGGLTIQAICKPASTEKPAIGGLLLWAERENFLRLDYGMGGPREITLLGCLANWDTVVGRGLLPDKGASGSLDAVSPAPIYLRLERSGELVRGFCSVDGERWFTVGQATFPAGGPVQVGLYAAGKIERSIYPGAYPEGTAIRFESFQLWRT